MDIYSVNWSLPNIPPPGQKRFLAYVAAPSFGAALDTVRTKFPDVQVTAVTKLNHDPTTPVFVYGNGERELLVAPIPAAPPAA